MRRKIFLALFFLLLLNCWFSCGLPDPPFKEGRYIIASKQTVRVPELDLSVTNNGCGRRWINEGGQPAYESEFCELLIKYKDSTISAGKNDAPVIIGNAKIQLDQVNSESQEEDSIPPAGCRVIITKLHGTYR